MRLLTRPQAPSNAVAEEPALGHRELVVEPIPKAAAAQTATQLISCNPDVMEQDMAVMVGAKELERKGCLPLLLPLPNCGLCELQ